MRTNSPGCERWPGWRRPESGRSWRFVARRAFRRFLAYALLLAILVISLNAVFTKGGPSAGSLGPLRFDVNGIAFGIRVSTRLILMSAAILLFFASTPLRLFAQYLEGSGVPMVFTSVLLLSLDFLEHIPSRVNQIFTAQESRGAPVREGLRARLVSLLTVLGPLVLSALVESIERSHALALRGFHLRRPQLRASTDVPRRGVAALLLALSVLLLAWGLWQLAAK